MSGKRTINIQYQDGLNGLVAGQRGGIILVVVFNLPNLKSAKSMAMVIMHTLSPTEIKKYIKVVIIQFHN